MALYLSNQDVDRLLTMKGCMKSIEGIYQELAIGDAVYRHRIDVFIPPGKKDSYFRWGTMEGGSRKTGFAIRMKSDMVYWTKWEGGRTEEKYCIKPGLFCGFILLFSAKNGKPLAMINDGVLQHMRVGACAGLGVKYLARPDATTVGMLGSGGMARTYLAAFCEVRKINKVKVFSPTKKNRERYAKEMEKALSLEVEPVDSAEKAVRGTDIVATCALRPRPNVPSNSSPSVSRTTASESVTVVPSPSANSPVSWLRASTTRLASRVAASSTLIPRPKRPSLI